MVFNRATNSTAVDIYKTTISDQPQTDHHDQFLHLRHQRSKSLKKFQPAYDDRAISNRATFLQKDHISKQNISSTSSWIDGLLGGKSKQGVYTADFLDDNGTMISVRDGETAILNCSVYLRHNKTVRIYDQNKSFLVHRKFLTCFNISNTHSCLAHFIS